MSPSLATRTMRIVSIAAPISLAPFLLQAAVISYVGLSDTAYDHAGLFILVLLARLLLCLAASVSAFLASTQRVSPTTRTTDILGGCGLGMLLATLLLFWWRILPSHYYSGVILPSLGETLAGLLIGISVGGFVGVVVSKLDARSGSGRLRRQDAS